MAQNPAKPDKPDKIVIHIDGTKYDVNQSSMTGAQIKALAQKDAQYQLFQEQHGNDPDKLIGDNNEVSLHNGDHFYTVPPASFGA